MTEEFVPTCGPITVMQKIKDGEVRSLPVGEFSGTAHLLAYLNRLNIHGFDYGIIYYVSEKDINSMSELDRLNFQEEQEHGKT